MESSHVLTPEELFCLEGCRSYGQYYAMRHNFELNFCTFCNLRPELHKILWEDEYALTWAVHPNFLRPELKYHFIIIPRDHHRFPWDLWVKELYGMQHARKFLSREFNLEGGIFVTRFGDMRLNGGTVPHLHENIMVPNGTGEVRIPAFKNSNDRAENIIRAGQFSIRYEGGESP